MAPWSELTWSKHSFSLLVSCLQPTLCLYTANASARDALPPDLARHLATSLEMPHLATFSKVTPTPCSTCFILPTAVLMIWKKKIFFFFVFLLLGLCLPMKTETTEELGGPYLFVHSILEL